MFRKSLSIGAILLIIFSCQQKAKKTIHYRQKIKTSDTITLPCAVTIEPTTHQIDSMKSGKDSADVFTAFDDDVFYMSTASHYLDSMKTKLINKPSKGNLIFKTISGEIYNVNLNNKYWAILLFNGKDKPIEGDITDISVDYQQYMGK